MKKNEPIQFLCFKLGEYFFGIDVMNIVEIVNFKGAETPPAADGEQFIKYNNRRLRVFHPGQFLLNTSASASVDYRVIVVEQQRKKIGLVVDSAEEIIRTTPGAIRDVELAETDLRPDVLYGRIVQEQKTVHLVDPEKMLAVVMIR
ncbi:hypothetical protein TRIP_C21590 [Candidatus Zixiibacteriota bacterium]|nr:hypothetical protein TRIP_C21590 [candidate division Zixibacteria bacterium]